MQAVEYLKTHRPVEPLTGSYEIELAAIDHCTDMSMNNLLSHIGTDGDNVKARIESMLDLFEYVHLTQGGRRKAVMGNSGKLTGQATDA